MWMMSAAFHYCLIEQAHTFSNTGEKKSFQIVFFLESNPTYLTIYWLWIWSTNEIQLCSNSATNYKKTPPDVIVMMRLYHIFSAVQIFGFYKQTNRASANNSSVTAVGYYCHWFANLWLPDSKLTILGAISSIHSKGAKMMRQKTKWALVTTLEKNPK